MKENKSTGQARPRSKYQPAHGTEFEGDVELIEAITAHSSITTRDFIARTTTIGVAVALGFTAAFGLVEGNFDKLRVTWDFAAPYIGYLFATYMNNGSHRRDDG